MEKTGQRKSRSPERSIFAPIAVTSTAPSLRRYFVQLRGMRAPSEAKISMSGTVPLMLLFASLGALMPRSWTKYLRKLGAVLVTAMGAKMLLAGLLLLR